MTFDRTKRRPADWRIVPASLLAVAMIVALAVNAPGIASAQEVSEEHMEAARAAVAASQMTRQLDSILPGLGEQTKQQLIAGRPDAAEQINAIVDEVTLSLAGRRGDLEAEIARGYARLFTVDELNEIAAFYSTDTGKKLVEQLPVIGRSIAQASRVWSAGVQRDMREMVREKLDEAGLR